MMEKKQRGGAREGSGRKRLNNVYLHVRMQKNIANSIKAKANEANKTIGEWISEQLIINKSLTI